MTKGIKRRLVRVYRRVDQTIAISTQKDSRFSRGLSSEGYNGGYRDAIADVLLALNGVAPSADRGDGWWVDPTPPSPTLPAGE